MSDKIKLPGWGHLDFSFDWRDWRKWALHAIAWPILLTYAAYRIVRYVVAFGWAMDLARLICRKPRHGPFGPRE